MTKRIYIPCFLVEGHQYHDEAGQILPSVTSVLKDELSLYQYGDMSAATRGANTHKACQYHDEGDLDEATISEEVRPYFERYKLALMKHGITVKQNELMRYSPKYMFAGTIDKVVEIAGKLAIVDIKTGAHEKWHVWQTAAYAELLRLEIGPLDRYDLYLGVDSHDLVKHESKRDFGEFLALMSARQIKINSGYLKIKGEQIQ